MVVGLVHLGQVFGVENPVLEIIGCAVRLLLLGGRFGTPTVISLLDLVKVLKCLRLEARVFDLR